MMNRYILIIVCLLNFSLGSRIRDIEIGPEGFIYLSLEYPGEIIQLRPINNSIN